MARRNQGRWRQQCESLPGGNIAEDPPPRAPADAERHPLLGLTFEETRMMVRGIIPTIVLMGLLGGLASGQVSGLPIGTGSTSNGTPNTCVVGTAVPPEIRWEGHTELGSDITLVCSGGTAITATSSGSDPATATSPNAIPQMTVTVVLNATVTSRILGEGGLSEALLLIDEPGAVGLFGYGPTLPVLVCPTPLATAWQSASSPGCQEWVGNIGTNTNVPVLSTNGQTNTTPGYNAFPGLVSGNTITFNGVPVLPEVEDNAVRAFRITNIRVSPAGLTPISLPQVIPPWIPYAVVATVSETGAALTLSDTQVADAYALSNLAATLQNPSDGAVLTPPVFAASSGVGSAGDPNLLGYLRFTEGVANSFRTRVNAFFSTTPGAGQSGTTPQDIPGAIYNSESGFIPYDGTTPLYFGGNTTYIPGLADSGTRVKAVFNNIPSGATIYVGTSSGGNSTTGIYGTLSAGMVNGPTAPESAALVASTITIGGMGFVPLVPSKGSATATWEVITAPLNQLGNFDIPVAVYAAPGAASPATVTVNLSYAPTYSDVQGQPQFIPSFADSSTPLTVFTIGTPPPPLLTWQSSNGSVVDWSMGGADGSAYQSGSLLAGASSGWRMAAVADLDGNGTPDLIWQYTDGSVVVWYMSGTGGGTYQSSKLLAGPSTGWKIVAAADLDGNGHPDLIWQYTDGTAVVWYMGGTDGSVYQSSKLLAGGSSGWRVAATADLDGNGHPDLIWQYTDGTVVVWYMGGTDGSVYQSSKLLAGASTGWKIVAAADLDDNGHPDLIWQYTDGTAVVWYMGSTDGGVYQSSKLLAGASTGWFVVGAGLSAPN